MKKILPIAALFLLFGCTQNQEGGMEPRENRQNNQPRQVKVNNEQIEERDRISIQEASNRLAQTAKEMPGVKGATAVAAGNYAIVGIDVEDDLDRSEVGSIKYTVAEGLKNQPYGANALVVADPDIYARLQEIGSDIQNGRPIEGLANELADIAGRTIPEIPGNITESDNAPDDATEQQKNKLSPNEDRQLEKEQEDQSNHHK